MRIDNQRCTGAGADLADKAEQQLTGFKVRRYDQRRLAALHQHHQAFGQPLQRGVLLGH
jgi:hypothetical protein